MKTSPARWSNVLTFGLAEPWCCLGIWLLAALLGEEHGLADTYAQNAVNVGSCSREVCLRHPCSFGCWTIPPGGSLDFAWISIGCGGWVYEGWYKVYADTAEKELLFAWYCPKTWQPNNPGTPGSSPTVGVEFQFDGCDLAPPDDGGGGGCRKGDDCCSGVGMPVWQVSEPMTQLWLHDEPLGYQPAAGPRVSLELGFKQRELTAGLRPEVFGLGKKWEFSWLSFVTQDGNTNNVLHFSDGAQRTFAGTNDYLTNTRLTGDATNGFTLSNPDGSKDIYGLIFTNDHHVFLGAYLTEHWNAYAQKTRLYYLNFNPTNPAVRLQFVVDGDGRTNSIYYVSTNDYSTNLIDHVVDAFGRTNSYAYDGQGHLTNITDVAGISTSLLYDEHDWVTNMSTLYGTTSFKFTDTADVGPNGRSVLVTQPDGSHHLYLATNNAPGIASSYATNEVPSTAPFSNTFDNAQLNLRNSFHWGPRQYANLSTTNISALTTNDFRKASMKHWLYSVTNYLGSNIVGNTLSLQRDPSPDSSGATEGQKTWYDYAGKTNAQYEGTQSSPLFVARVLPDGTTQFTRTDRNSFGSVLTDISTYSVGASVSLRTNIFAYAANDVDLLTSTNAVGVQVSSNNYNTNHQVLTNYNALGEATVYTYNTSQELTSVTRPSGLITTNVYDGNGLLTTTYDYAVIGGGPVYYRTNSYTYANDLVLTHTDERGLITTSAYDNLQRITNSSDSRGAIAYTYDKLDLTKIVDRMGFTSTFGYDSMRRKIAETNALGFTTFYNYCTCGSLDWIQDAAGNYTLFFYDNQARLINTVNPDWFSTTNSYNLLGQIINSTDSAGATTMNWFNNQALSITISNALGLVQNTTYDALDRATNTVDANGVSITTTYDNLNRPRTRTYPDSGVEALGYSADTASLTSFTNQIGNVTRYLYDPLGRKTTETNANLEVIQFSYGPAGDLLTLTDGKNQTTAWHYDQYGRATNKLDAAASVVFVYHYDQNNRLTNRWTPAKGSTAYAYDSVGNLTSIQYPVSSSISMAYDVLNRLTNMVDAVGTTKYTYTAGSQLLTDDGPFDNDTITNAFANRLRTGLTLQQPTGSWTNGFGYDTAKHATSVASPAGTFAYTLGAAAPASSLAKKLLLPNSAYVTNTYDSVARLTGTYLKNSSGAALDSYVYAYNPAQERTNLTRADTSTVAYRYDPIGQLKVANSSVNSEDRGYAYDAAWNLNYLTNNGAAYTFSVDTDNQLQSVELNTYSYDTNGNLVLVVTPAGNSASYIYCYDDENRLIRWRYAFAGPVDCEASPSRQDVATDFAYDGLGRLRRRIEYHASGGAWVTDSETRYVYDGMLVIQERDGDNNPLVSYTRGSDLSASLEGAGGIGGLLARSEGTNHAYYFADGNGNITYMLNGSQSMASYRYDPFGNTISQSGSLADANVYRFSSKEIHVNSGMYYYGGRFYDPNLQRWITRDPIGERGGLNLYGFCEGDPIGRWDGFGYYDIGCCDDAAVKEGRQKLINGYNTVHADLEKNGIPHRGHEGSSCQQVNGYTLTVLAPTPRCWTCNLEHRQDFRPVAKTYPHPQIADHWVVVCQSHPKSGPYEEITFDYWKDRPAGESPDHFRGAYPQQIGGTIHGGSIDCGGTITTAPDFGYPTPHK